MALPQYTAPPFHDPTSVFWTPIPCPYLSILHPIPWPYLSILHPHSMALPLYTAPPFHGPTSVYCTPIHSLLPEETLYNHYLELCLLRILCFDERAVNVQFECHRMFFPSGLPDFLPFQQKAQTFKTNFL
jgi:hypothetical protein